MFTSLFTFPVWFWSCLFFAAIAIPILIHLIRLVRFKVVHWPAMEFLILSQKRRRRKVWLSKFLLIMTRILLLLIAVVVFANIQFDRDDSDDNTSGTLHLVILDDSFSMGERSIDFDDESGVTSTCFDFAKTAVLDLAKNLVQQPNQRVVIVRTCDLTEQSVANQISSCDSQWLANLKTEFGEMSPTDLAISPLRKLLEVESVSFDADHVRLYVVSDFRNKDWRGNETKKVVSRLTDRFDLTRLIHCAEFDRRSKNLCIQMLKPENKVLAANVPFFLKLVIRNRSDVDRTDVQVEIRKTFGINESWQNSRVNSNPAANMSGVDDSVSDLEIRNEPTVLIKKIKANSVVTTKFPILLSEAGTHVIEARLPDDDLLIDNFFQRVVDIPITNQVLLIAENQSRDVNYLSWLFQPKGNGTTLNTGFNVDVQSMQTVASQSANNLERYRAIFLLSDDLVNVKSIALLEQYVKEGGLLFVIPGNSADPKLLTKHLYRGGDGVLPFAIASAIEISERNEGTKTDITFVNPNFKNLFRGESEKLISLIQFQRKFIPPRNWSPGAGEDVIANLRGRATTPLIVSRQLGFGRSIVILSPFDNRWNNWAKNPTFVVLVFQLINFYSEFSTKTDLAVPAQIEEESPIGTIVESRLGFRRQLDGFSESSSKALVPGEKRIIKLSRKGLSVLSGNGATRFIATHIDNNESDLNLLEKGELEELGDSDRIKLVSWNEVSIDDPFRTKASSYPMLLVLLALFFVEQILAYRLGFHSRKGSADA